MPCGGIRMLESNLRKTVFFIKILLTILLCAKIIKARLNNIKLYRLLSVISLRKLPQKGCQAMIKSSKKTFFSVEAVILLVILAVLIFVFIDSFSDYKDRLNEKAVISDGRNLLMAAQAASAQKAAAGDGSYTLSSDYDLASGDIKAIFELAGVSSGALTVTVTDGRVTGLVYEGSSFSAIYSSGNWSTEKIS